MTNQLLLSAISFVGEAIAAGVAGGRGIGEGAVAVKRDGAVGGVGDLDGGEGIAVGVGVVRENAGSGHGERGIFGGGVAVISSNGSIIGLIPGNLHCLITLYK